MGNDEQALYQIFITNPDHVDIASDSDFELYHSETETHDCDRPCKTCKFQDVSSCAISKEEWPELYKALTEYFSEHYPEKFI